MKKLFVACVVLFLASCIEVDDFGDSWDKASIDPSLAGKWEKISEIDEAKTTGRSWTFTLKNGAYEIQTFNQGKPDEDGPISPVKSFTAGPYTFLAKGPDKGAILRYKVARDTITFYVIDPEAEWAFIQTKFPGQDSFYRGEADEPEDENDPQNMGDPVKIGKLDEEALKILASIPDTDHFWDPDTVVRRAK